MALGKRQRCLIPIAVPTDYDDLLSYYTKRGYRVIAMAGKSIEGLTWLRAQRLKRYVASIRLQGIWLISILEGSKRNMVYGS